MAQATFPVIFTLRDLVYGDGFVAGVTTRGRAVMEQCEDDWWCYGVQPGALAGSGATPREAYDALRVRLTAVLFDIASETKGITGFRTAVEDFFVQEDPIESQRWADAVTVFRSGEPIQAAFFVDLPRQPADVETFVKVENLTAAQSVTAGTNFLPELAVPPCGLTLGKVQASDTA